MVTVATKIRLALLSVAFVSISTSLLSLHYMNRIIQKFQVIAVQDARIAELAESMSIKMLEARREEKNFIIFFDSLYIEQNRKLVSEIRTDIDEMAGLLQNRSAELDSVRIFVTRYHDDIEKLLKFFLEEPQTLYKLQQQVINYEKELKSLARKQRVATDDLPGVASDINMSLLSASRRMSSDKAALILDLRETSNKVHQLTQEIAANAQKSLLSHSSEGINYGTMSQRNILTILLIVAFSLIYLIVYFPRIIFRPLKKVNKALQAIAKGEIEHPLPQTRVKDEFGELSQSFESAVANLRYFDTIKTNKIIEIEKTFRRTVEEIKEPVLLLYPDLKISYINLAAKTLFSVVDPVTTKPLKEVPKIWDLVGEHLVDVEKQGRFEFNHRMSKMELREKKIIVIPITGKTGKLESILVIIK